MAIFFEYIYRDDIEEAVSDFDIIDAFHLLSLASALILPRLQFLAEAIVCR